MELAGRCRVPGARHVSTEACLPTGKGGMAWGWLVVPLVVPLRQPAPHASCQSGPPSDACLHTPALRRNDRRAQPSQQQNLRQARSTTHPHAPQPRPPTTPCWRRAAPPHTRTLQTTTLCHPCQLGATLMACGCWASTGGCSSSKAERVGMVPARGRPARLLARARAAGGPPARLRRRRGTQSGSCCSRLSWAPLTDHPSGPSPPARALQTRPPTPTLPHPHPPAPPSPCSSHAVLRHAPQLAKLCLTSQSKLELGEPPVPPSNRP